ncbi:hypothetical protein DK419_09335 [Methylobacterium terrae]|uniref:Uncharacterized protein n=1 Tax=Methylobacterium terrae TaxID=2202827 RepID=A0A2U8WMQ3_9HYPH|nr:hypothetical protein [Methylobacterium terrae]AWN46492.1 hypothetical protein DK419_09335 [Methylobacterium terrae]
MPRFESRLGTDVVEACDAMDRDDPRPGLRITRFERRGTIASHVTPDGVAIDRLLDAGRAVDVTLRVVSWRWSSAAMIPAASRPLA